MILALLWTSLKKTNDMLRNALPFLLSTVLIAGITTEAISQEAVPVVAPDNGSTAMNAPVVNGGSGSRDVFTMATSMSDNAMMCSAIKACGLESGIRSRSSITIFIPNNAAFAKLPPGLVEQLMKPENVAILSKIVSYHIIEGNITIAAMREAIKAGRGRAEYTTLSGNKIVATLEDNKVRLTDDGNKASFVTASDIKASNGTIHVVDKVALPR